MARPKSEDKRNRLMAAATRVIAARGLSAPTAAIARAAGISNGLLFTYFETKAELYNTLLLELRSELAKALLRGLPNKASQRDQLSHLWGNWMRWATRYPEKRRVSELLAVSNEITPVTRAAVDQTMIEIMGITERARSKGPMQDAPLAFVTALLSAISDATMNFIAENPGSADEVSLFGFDAVWRVLAG